jgi:hypothetical protein
LFQRYEVNRANLRRAATRHVLNVGLPQFVRIGRIID